MVVDADTNFLYLADSLKFKYPNFYERFIAVLTQASITYGFLKNTRDVWSVDYMPLQIKENVFVQFTYQPSYLQTKYYRSTISDVDGICDYLQICPIKTTLKVDGGNIVRSTNSVVMTERVFKENSHCPKQKIISTVHELLEVDNLYFIPDLSKDFTGHADGMLRFLDDKTVLVNDFSKEDTKFKKLLKDAIRKARLELVEIPYNVYSNKSIHDASGTYINYLQMKDLLIVPTYNSKADDIVISKLELLFPSSKILTVNCCDIAKKGGVLNCISWNVKKWWQ